jgi:hypothetical protein
VARVFAYVLLVSRVTSKPRRGLPPGGDWRSEVAGCVNGRYLRLAESGLTEDRSPPTRPYPRASQQSASVPEHDRGGSNSLSRNCGCDSAVVRPRKDNTSSFHEEGAPISLSCSRKGRNGTWPLFTPPAKISPSAGQLGQWWILTDLTAFRASDRAHAWFFWSWGRHRPAGLRDSFPNPAEAELPSNGGWFETRRFVEQPAEVGAQPTDRRASMSLRDPAGSRSDFLPNNGATCSDGDAKWRPFQALPSPEMELNPVGTPPPCRKIRSP